MNRIAIVTGGSSGIGHGTVLALAARGIDSLVTWNRNAAGVEDVVAAAKSRGARAVPLRLDVGSSASFAGFAAEVAATLQREFQAQRFDYLVNNAGASDMAPFEGTTEAQFDDLARVLLKGPYFLTQALLPHLADGGAIVNVTSSSTHPTSVTPGFSAYATMKGGLVTLTRYLAKELAPRRIRVNSVAPGPTRTRLGGGGFDRFPEMIPPLVAKTALGRLGEPGDIGGAIAALLSDDCRWVTGQDVEVSGGYGM